MCALTRGEQRGAAEGLVGAPCCGVRGARDGGYNLSSTMLCRARLRNLHCIDVHALSRKATHKSAAQQMREQSRIADAWKAGFLIRDAEISAKIAPGARGQTGRDLSHTVRTRACFVPARPEKCDLYCGSSVIVLRCSPCGRAYDSPMRNISALLCCMTVVEKVWTVHQ